MDYKIEDVWKVEQEILDVIDEVCRKNNLKYSLFAGTLLGAIRHGGFIPWDDDIDIVMPRNDYEKLIEVWKKDAPERYLLQNKITHNDFNQNFSKVRKQNTTFIQYEFEKDVSYNTGIFVDIFPADRLAVGIIARKIQYCACAINLLMARDFQSGNKGFIGFVERCFLSLPKSIKRRVYILSNNVARRGGKNTPFFVFDTIDDMKEVYSPSVFDELTTIAFAGKYYLVVKDYKEMLKIHFGDYMQLPPEQHRVLKHHPLIVDTRNSYKKQGVE